MAQVIHNTPQEFWRPPAVVPDEIIDREAVPAMAETCQRCATEFLLGSRFCHTCGGRRREVVSVQARNDAAALAALWQNGVSRVQAVAASIPWEKMQAGIGRTLTRLGRVRSIPFSGIKRRIGLSTLPLAAFLVGVGSIVAALLLGLLPAKTSADWQAIQLYRVEFLLAATAAFVAGILLKKPLDRDSR